MSSTLQVCDSVERRVKAHVFERRIRLKSFFEALSHMDPKRVSKANFRRTLDNAGCSMTDEELNSIAHKYDIKHKKIHFIDYQSFLKEINSVFNPSGLESNPGQQMVDGSAFCRHYRNEKVRKNRGESSLNRSQHEQLASILQLIRDRVLRNRTDIEPVLHDFDRTNSGTVTHNQFHKSLCTLGFRFSSDDIELLQWRYTSGEHPEDFNYKSFCNDIRGFAPSNNVSDENSKARDASNEKANDVSLNDEVNTQSCLIDDVLYRLRAQSLIERIRLFPMFRDCDPLRSNRISVERFRSTLNSVGDIVLSEEELSALLHEFAHDKDQSFIDYHRFNLVLESANTVPYLEKSPQTQVNRLTLKHVVEPFNACTEGSTPVGIELAKICEWIKHHEVDFNTFFRDHDRTNTGTISNTQFRSVLSSFGLVISTTASHILCSRFARQNLFDYRSFVAALSTQIHTQQPKSLQLNMTNLLTKSPRENGESVVDDDLDFHLVLAKLQDYILKRHIRLSEFFTDFDTLKTGLVVVPSFQRVLHLSGFMCTQTQAQTLYRPFVCVHPDMPQVSCVNYSKFLPFVNSVFVRDNLEKHPHINIPVNEIPTLPSYISHSIESVSTDDNAMIDDVLLRLYNKAFRLSCEPRRWFTDFDKLKCGFVSTHQFRSSLTNSCLSIDDEEFKLLYKRFQVGEKSLLSKGFATSRFMSYKMFCDDLDEFCRSMKKNRCEKNEKNALHTNAIETSSEIPKNIGEDEITIERVLSRIQTRVSHSQISIQQFFSDYDTLRSGVVSAMIFRRVLDVQGFSLSDKELAVLLQRYATKNSADQIQYKQFVNEINAAFVPRTIEKNPHEQLKPFVVYDADVCRTDLQENDEECEKIENSLNCIADAVRKRGLNLKTYMDDFDRNNIGSINPKHFHSVISNLVFMISTETCRLLHKRFHCGDNINLRKFIDDVERRAIERGKQLGKNTHSNTIALTRTLTTNIHKNSHLSLERVMRRLETFASQLGLRPRCVFEAYDGLRTGRVSAAVFHRVLDALKFNVSSEELTLLVNAFTTSDNEFVSYRDFCNTFEQAFSPLELEKNPSSTFSAFIPINLHNDVNDIIELNVEQNKLADDAMTRLARIAFKRRFTIKSYCNSFDRTHNGSIPRVRFSSILQNMFGIILDMPSVDALCIRFRKGDCVDYMKLCVCLDEAVEDMAQRSKDKKLL